MLRRESSRTSLIGRAVLSTVISTCSSTRWFATSTVARVAFHWFHIFSLSKCLLITSIRSLRPAILRTSDSVVLVSSSTSVSSCGLLR